MARQGAKDLIDKMPFNPMNESLSKTHIELLTDQIVDKYDDPEQAGTLILMLDEVECYRWYH